MEPPVKDFTYNDSFNKRNQFVDDNIIGCFSIIGPSARICKSWHEGDDGNG